LSYGGNVAAKSHGLESIMPKTSIRSLPYEVWALIAGMFTVALGYGVVAPVIPAFALEFGVGFAAASAIVSAFAVTRLMFAPASGWLVKRLGERRVYIAGLLIVAISTGASALSMNYVQLLILRSLGGIGSIMFSVAAMGLLIKLSPVDARARVASLNSGSFMAGAVIGPLLGALVAGLGLRAPFVVYFFLLLVAASVVAFSLRNSSIVANDESEPTHPAMRLSAALSIPQYRAALGSTFAHGWATIGVRSTLVPLFAVAVLGQSAVAAGWMLAAFAIANLIVLFPAGRLADRIGRKPMILAGLIVSAIGLSALSLSDDLVVALMLVALSGAGSALMAPSQQAVVADVVGNKARGGQVLAVFQMATDLGAVIGPIIAGLIVDAFGFDTGFATTSLILVASAVYWMFTPDSRAQQVPTQTGAIPIQPEAG